MDVIIAARLSQLHDERGQQIGIDTQDEDAQEWAEHNDHNVVATVADAKSGTSAMWDRPNLRPWVTQPDLMAKYQGIVAAKQDRLSRADWSDEVELRQWADRHHKTLFIVEPEMIWPPREDAHHDDDVANWNRGAESAHREWRNTSRRYRRMQKGKIARGSVVGRATYGLRIMPGVNEKGQAIKTLAPYEPEAKIIREATRRYLSGETIDATCDDLNARGIPSPTWKGQPGKHWYAKTLASLLRSPSIAGRRYPRGKNNLPDEKKPVITTYEPIITWDEHQRLVARLDSRAHRKGISPGNVALLTSLLFDAEGHPMYRYKTWQGFMYYCRKCHIGVDLEYADKTANWLMSDSLGMLAYKVQQLVPGENHNDEIDRLRQDRAELDDLSDDYDRNHAEITAEIRRLAALPAKPDHLDWVITDKTLGDVWAEWTTAERRDYLLTNGFRFHYRGGPENAVAPEFPEKWIEEMTLLA